MTMRTFKKLFETFKRAEIAATEIERRWDADPENEALEKAFDVAYELEHKAMTELQKAIVEYTGGMVDMRTAYIMICKYPDRLASLVARIA